MELLLDTANLEKLSEALEFYPVSGLTTNPSIFKKEGKPDFFAHARELRNLLGNKRTFHVQVVSPDCEGILREADAIRRNIDEFVYIKTPVSREGLKAIGIMAKEGFNVTATAIYTTMQGQLAAMAGGSAPTAFAGNQFVLGKAVFAHDDRLDNALRFNRIRQLLQGFVVHLYPRLITAGLDVVDGDGSQAVAAAVVHAVGNQGI